MNNEIGFRQALKEVMCEKMTEHEFVTLVRYFRGDSGQEKSPRREMIRFDYAMCHYDYFNWGVKKIVVKHTFDHILL